MTYDNHTTSSELRRQRLTWEEQLRHFSVRLRAALQDETLRSFASRAKVNEGTLRNLLSGGLPKLDSLVRIAEAAGVSVDWLATGEGPMRVQDLVATRLQGAEKLIALALDQIELDRKENNQVTLAEDVLAEGLQELRKIAAEQNATEQQRARADAVAEAVFQDEEAAARNASRMQTVGARARSAKERVAFACKEFDYTPGLVMGHVLQNLVFKYDVTLDDLAQLIQALQQE